MFDEERDNFIVNLTNQVRSVVKLDEEYKSIICYMLKEAFDHGVEYAMSDLSWHNCATESQLDQSNALQ